MPTPAAPTTTTTTRFGARAALPTVDARASLPAPVPRCGALAGLAAPVPREGARASLAAPTPRAAFAALALLCGAACGFSDGTPGGAVILCASAAACGAAQRCDLEHHVCVDAHAAALGVTSVAFDPPAIAHGIARLTIRADGALDANTPPVVTFASTAPVVSDGATDGSEQTILVDADASDEGVYPLASVAVTGADGVVASLATTASLIVDRTSPVLFNVALVAPPAGAIYADVAPADQLTVHFLASEPITDGAALSLGAASGACTADAASSLSFTCSAAIDGAGVNGASIASINAADLAGNTARADIAVVVDAAAPHVVDDAVSLDVRTAGQATSFARADSRVTLTFVTDEALGADPVAALDVDGTPLPLTLDHSDGRRYTFDNVTDFAVVPGVYGIHVTLVDALGHRSDDVALSLPAPFSAGIPFIDDAAVCPRPPGMTCSDVDGDGGASRTSCADGDDVDDLDPSSRNGASPEIPGDGADNDGLAGDQPIDLLGGTFVDSELGDDGNPGTAARPVQTLDGALAISGTFTFLFLAARATPYTTTAPDIEERSFVGGLDADHGWVRTDGRSAILNAIANAFVVDSIDAASTVTTSQGLVVRSRVSEQISMSASPAAIVDTLASSADFDADQAVIVDSTIDFIDTKGSVFVSRTHASNINLNSGSGSLVGVNSVIDSVAGVPVDGGGGFAVTLVHCTVIQRSTADLPAVYSQAPDVVLIGTSVITASAHPPLDFGSQQRVTLVDNNFFGPGGVPTQDFDIDGMNLCLWSGCTEAHGNTNVDPGNGLSSRITATSPLRDRDVRAYNFVNAPPAIIADVDGDCRYTDGLADVGADEFR